MCAGAHTFLFFRVGKAGAQDPFFYFIKMKWDQRINITFSGDGFVEDDGAQGQNDAAPATLPVKEGSENQDQDSHKFQRVAQFEAGLEVICHGDESHIKHGFAAEPAGFYGIFSQNDTGDYAQRCGKHTGSIDGCKPQAVNGKFKEQKLIKYRYMGRLRQTDKIQPGRDGAGVLQKHQPQRR